MRRTPHPCLRGELIVVIGCADLARAAEFWTGVLGYVPEGPALGRYLGLIPADGQGAEILLQRVPEKKRDKNRVHLDLRTPDLESEVNRVLGLGCVQLTEQPIEEFGWRWHVLADPEGSSSLSGQALAEGASAVTRQEGGALLRAPGRTPQAPPPRGRNNPSTI